MEDQKNHSSLSIIIPAKNEGVALNAILPRLRQILPRAEIIVVNDGSSDDTESICRAHDVVLLSHPYSVGNGAAIKSGARIAKGKILVFMDADGQHHPEDIQTLTAQLEKGYDMAVGARSRQSQATIGRSIANTIYNLLASWMVGRKIDDLTSGFRAVDAEIFRDFLYLLPNGFSYPTTITMSFFRAGYRVSYVPIHASPRHGKSHIRIVLDGLRFLTIIFKIGTLYSPLKLFLPISLGFFMLGLGYYAYTFLSFGRFTNMSGLLFTTSLLIFLIGLVSEQITMLLYRGTGKK
ncbi:MAG: glycosyltransferase family 2 protein [Sulfuricaulis sp.]|uniref:glycosyltransferase family 2 protein n=1 Tax=Sulfuricaulis sp. TaxID=2003553 RepID=UPI0026012CC6|nr:glycosyltransferase family 2 protein [Sulfuricaulis sp.]MCR4346785.1 glycosyltransferase family 2 protein [Sulfuricaulis sp.]